jgi:hypothetical protein
MKVSRLPVGTSDAAQRLPRERIEAMTPHNPHATTASSVRPEEDFSNDETEASLHNASDNPQAEALLERLRQLESEAMRALKTLASHCHNDATRR